MGLEEKFVEQSWILNAHDFSPLCWKTIFHFLLNLPFSSDHTLLDQICFVLNQKHSHQ